jgi:hypothetical protein
MATNYKEQKVQLLGTGHSLYKYDLLVITFKMKKIPGCALSL